MAMRTKSSHLESWLLECFENIHTVEIVLSLPPLFLLSSCTMCFLDITLPVKCAHFTGYNDAFAATGIQVRSSWRQRQQEEWAENQGQVAEGDTWFLLISWNQLFWRPSKDLTRVYPFPLTLPFFFSRWYFNFLLFPGKDNGDSPSPQVHWNKVGIFQKEHLLGN